MDSSKKTTPVTKVVRENEASPPPPPPSTRQGGGSHVAGHQVLEACFPRGSSRRTYHSSPFDYVEYSVKDESPPRPSSDLEAVCARSGEKRKRGIGRGRIPGNRMRVSPNMSSGNESKSSDNVGLQPSSRSSSSSSSRSSSAAAAAVATVKASPSTTTTGNEAAGFKPKDLSSSQKGAVAVSKEHTGSLEGDPDLNAGKLRYVSPCSRRSGHVGSGRLRLRSFGMGISSRGGARSLGSGSSREWAGEVNEWAGGYGSDGIRAREPTLPRGAVRGLYHFPNEDEPRYRPAQHDPDPTPPPSPHLANRRGEKEETEMEDQDVESILQTYFKKYL